MRVQPRSRSGLESAFRLLNQMDFGIDAQIEFTAADEQGATHATGRLLSLQIKAMSVWLAGAGVKGGIVHGATDELGYAAVENVATVHDLHATMLHQLGIQHESFTYKFQGLDAKLTGVEPSQVIKDILT